MYASKGKNGVRHPFARKKLALTLREEGKTHREISRVLRISLGTAYLWTKDIVLSEKQKKDIQKRKADIVFTPALRSRLSRAAREHLKPYQYKQKHTKESLKKRIRDFYVVHGRIPVKREFGDPRVYRTHYGTWNNAIRSAGFDPNPVLFAKKFTAKDGHRCDSFTERIIDDWLSSRGILHERHWRYGRTKMTADFCIDKSTLIEFFGLAGVQKEYDRIIERKRILAQQLGVRLIEVLPQDIFPTAKFEMLFAEFLGK